MLLILLTLISFEIPIILQRKIKKAFNKNYSIIRDITLKIKFYIYSPHHKTNKLALRLNRKNSSNS